MKTAASLLLALTFIVCIVACGDKVEATGIWKDATYTSDTTIGEGANTVTVIITAEDRTVTLTVKTDKATLGEALYEHGVINDPTFFDTCNGMKADWDKDHAYWAFYVGDEMAQYGVGDEKAVTTEEPTYKIVYTK